MSWIRGQQDAPSLLYTLVIAIGLCQRAKVFTYTRALFYLFRNVINYRNL